MSKIQGQIQGNKFGGKSTNELIIHDETSSTWEDMITITSYFVQDHMVHIQFNTLVKEKFHCWRIYQ